MRKDDTLTISSVAALTKRERIPFQVTIELLNECNFRCIHCYLPEHNCHGISFDKVIDIFQQLRQMGVLCVNLTGGELFVREDIMKIIRAARDMHFSVTLLSNASLITDDMARELASLYISAFSTTIFSLDPTINDQITGTKGSLTRVLAGVNLLKKYGISVQIKTPLMQQNKFEYRKLITFCKENGFSYLPSAVITGKLNGDRSTLALRLNDDDFRTVYNETADYIALSDNDDTVEEDEFYDFPCSLIRNTLSIDCYGNVYPCNSYLYRVGNIYDHDLSYIWNESDAYARINAIRRSDLQKCAQCELQKFCLRCPGRALLEDGDDLGCSSIDKRYALLHAERHQNIMQ